MVVVKRGLLYTCTDMTEETPIAKTLKEILHTQSFDQLGSFTDSTVWGTLTSDERELLARLFLMAGESELKRSSLDASIQNAKKYFTLATNLAPHDGYIWFRRGLAFAFQENVALLEESSLCFEKATEIDSQQFETWYAWADVFVRRGIATQDASLFLQAEDKFQKAEKLLTSHEKYIDFYWHFGICYFMQGRSSGEAVDTHNAIGCYRKAKALGLTRSEFYNDFANALIELSILINNQEYMFEAIELYLYSLDNTQEHTKNPKDTAVRYCNLGACYQYLFETHHEAAFFNQAQECFTNATELQPDFGNAWAFWGYMLLYGAKLWQDINMLEGCLDKLSHLANYAEDKPLLLARMSEAFSLYGSNEDELQYLMSAQEIAETATIEDPELPYGWASLALSNLELARYFDDDSYFEVAVENAERAIALNQNIGMAWHVLAVAKFSLAEVEGNVRLMQEACAAFSVAAKTEVGRFGYMWNDWGIALLNLADITHDKRFVQEAIEKFEQGILLHEHVNPIWLINYASSLDFWGEITDEEEHYEKAIEVLEHALSIDATNLQAHYQLGQSYCHLGELTNDLSLLEKGIEELQVVLQEDLEDEAASADLGVAYMNVADLAENNVEVKKSLYELAEQHFLQAINLGSHQVYYNLACLYSLQKNAPEAYHFLLKAYEHDTLPPINEVCLDRWLEHLRTTAHFKHFIQKVQPNSAENN